MGKNEWYALLEKWAFDDERLHRLPFALIEPLSERLANWQAVEQPRAADWASQHGFYLVCKKCLEINCDGTCETPNR